MPDPLPESSPVLPSPFPFHQPGTEVDDLLASVGVSPQEGDDMGIACDIADKELPAGYQLRGYRIVRPLGSGGFGVTYLAHDIHLDRPVVIKESFPNSICYRQHGTLDVRLHQESEQETYQWALGNFLREARLLSTLDHPTIAKVYTYFEEHRTAYYVTEYIDGSSLGDVAEDYLRHRMFISQNELYGMMIRVLDALNYLHDRRLLHRDIKPDNILVDRLGFPMLIDFGAAREAVGDLSSSVVESQGFSPSEQSMSGGNMGPWTDLYAFGATLYYVLTHECLPSCRLRELSDPVAPLAADERLLKVYHPKLLASIDRAIRPSIDQRYHNVAEWMEDLHL